MYVQPLEGSISPNALASPAGNAAQEGALSQGALAPTAGDNISRFVPPGANDGALDYGGSFGSSGSLQGVFGSLMGVLEQLMQVLQSLMGGGSSAPYGSGGCNPPWGSGGPYGSGSCPPGSGGCSPYGNERFFQNANGSSEGDPHLSFNGLHLLLVAYKKRPRRGCESAEAMPNGRYSSDDSYQFTPTSPRRRKSR